MYDLRPVEVDDAGIRQCAELLDLVFPGTGNFTEEFIRWEYADNPAGPIVGFNAWADDVLAGHYVTQPAPVKLFGESVKALLSMNTATHPDHRGKRLFTTLADKTYEYAAEQGYSCVFGVANANSTHGFLKYLGFQLVCPLEARVGLGRVREAPTDASWQFEREWPADHLEWRCKNPKQAYEVSGDGLWVPTGTAGIKGLLGRFATGDLAKVRSEASSTLNPAKLYIGLDGQVSWGTHAYLPIPAKLKPSPLNLIFKDLTGEGRTLDPQQVKFRLLDFDAY